MGDKIQQGLKEFNIAMRQLAMAVQDMLIKFLERFLNALKKSRENKMETEVFNGKVKPGDKITYQVRNGSNQYVRVAEVLEVTERLRYSWDDETVPALRVRVIDGNEFRYQFGPPQKPYVTNLTVLNRVVKING